MPSPASTSILAEEFSIGSALSIVFACLALMVLVVAAAVLVQWYRKWLRSNPDTPAGGFTLSDLRALYKQGKISSEEFERTKAMIIGEAKKTPNKPPPAPPQQKI